MITINANGEVTDDNNESKCGRKRRHNNKFNYCYSNYLLVFLVILGILLQDATTTMKTTSTMVLSFSIIKTKPIFRGATTRSSSSKLYSKLGDFLSGINAEVEELEHQQRVVSNVSKVDDNGWIDVLSSLEKKHHDSKTTKHQQQKSSEKSSSSSSSPVEVLTVRGRIIHVKHDDQLRLSGSGISGNKARKMYTLNEISASDFPQSLVSYGGPQSNSMLALAAIVNYKNRELLAENIMSTTTKKSTTRGREPPLRFVYYTKKLPRFLRNQPNGNLYRALSLGMELKELTHEEYNNLFEHRSEDFDGGKRGYRPPMGLNAPAKISLFVPQGGAFAASLVGVNRLSKEIYTYWLEHGNNRPLTVCVPCGTCTTALCLHHGIKRLLLRPDNKDDFDGHNDDVYDDDDNDNSDYSQSARSTMDIRVVAIPCVGDAAYARRQMMSLSSQIGADADDIPTILQPEPEERGYLTGSSLRRNKYFTFGKPNQDILEIFQELQNEYNLVVDLLYGAPSFAIMFRHWGKNKNLPLRPDLSFDPNQPLSAGREILYVHSGGLEGINSQLLRYQHIGLLKIEDIQLPGRRNVKKGTDPTST